MNHRHLTSPVLVYNQAAFGAMLAHLGEQKLLALDTESDSLYSYHTKVCLIQITTLGDGADEMDVDPKHVVDYLVDPLRFNALEPLGELLADPAMEVIIHAAENDIALLQREFGFSFARLFDTQLAARILGWVRAGLAAILEEQFGVVSDKRMQRTDWGKRPLTPEQIAYAQMDTHYLPALRARQIKELHERGRWEEAQEAFAQLAALNYSERSVNERNFWQMKETRQVDHADMNVLQALWQWREREAERQDRPPFKIVRNQALVDLAQRKPTTQQALERLSALSSSEAKRYGAAILAAIRQGKQQPLPPLPEPSLRPEQLLDRLTLDRFDALRKWRAATAQARGVAPDIVLTNDILMEVAKRRPQTLDDIGRIEGIGPWKAKTYGPDLVRIVNR